jgi:hypothetical protein
MVFGDFENFVDHTGYFCSRRLLRRLRERYYEITKKYDEAKKSLTEEGMEMVLFIESGKLILTKYPRSRKSSKED